MHQLRLLGTAVLEGPDGPLTGPAGQRHRIALLALLAAGGPVAQTRDRLLGMLWPEHDTRNARQLLNLSVHVLRQALGRSTIRSVGDGLLLDTTVLPTDLVAFESALAGDRPLEAMRHYSGPFLQGFFLPRASEFDRWADGIRASLARRRSEALRHLAREREEAGDLWQAITWWREVVTEEPGDGPAVCALMQVLGAAGDRASAILAARTHARFMAKELEAEPDAGVMRLAEALRGPAPPAPLRGDPAPHVQAPPIIAVKPFVAGEGGPFVGLGENIAREVIVALTASGRLRVTANPEAPGADLVLEGTVRGSDGRLRVTANLISVRQGLHLWSTASDHRGAGSFTLAEEVAGGIAAEVISRVGADLPPLPGAEQGGTALLLRGRYALGRRTMGGLRTALRYFTRAVETSPADPIGHASLAEAYAVMGWYDDLAPAEAFGSARRAAEQALRLSPRLTSARAILAYVNLYGDWDFDRSERRFRQAITRDPRMGMLHHWYGNMLVAAGRAEEAIREMQIASGLDPLSLVSCAARGWACYHGGRLSEAVDHCDHTLELDPNFAPAHLWRGLALGGLARWDDAVLALRRARELCEESRHATSSLAYALARADRRQEAEALLAGQLALPGYLPSYDIAKVMLALGRPRESMSWLERSARERSHSMAFLRMDPQLIPLRDDPAFGALLDRTMRRLN